jgi:hypothetical protein
VKKSHWYKIVRNICQVCGDGDEYRERQNTPRPKKWEDRHESHVAYCGCLDHQFL